MSPAEAAALLPYLTAEERAELDSLLKHAPVWAPLPGPQSIAYQSKADIIGFGGAAGGGKGLALDTPLPTPTGWTTMGEVQPGDVLLDDSGQPCRVTAASAVSHRPCYRLRFDDGSELIADDVHRWVTHTTAERRTWFETGTLCAVDVRDTRELSRTIGLVHAIYAPHTLGGNVWRYLVACEPVPSVPTRCIAVDSPTRQYLAGRACIPTHNTDLACGKALTQHQKIMVLRRVGTELTGILDRFSDLIGNRNGYNGQDKIWRTKRHDGTKLQIEFGAVPNIGDETKYQGRPHDLLIFDEAANFLEMQIRFLLGWNRSTDPNQRCQALLTFNPPTSAEGRWIIQFFGPWLDPKHPRYPAAPGAILYAAMIPHENGTSRDVWVDTPAPFVLVNGQMVYDFNPDDFKPTEVITPKSRTFIPSRVTDNPYLAGTGYMSTLQSLPEPLRSQMLNGDFAAGVQDDPWQVIPTAWVEAAQARWVKPARVPEMLSMGIDVARGGQDNTVIARRHVGMWFDEMLVYPGAQTPNGPAVAGLVMAAMRDHAVMHVDVIGVGASPYDFLASAKLDAVGVNVSEKAGGRDASGRLAFRNKRSELWWRMREALDPSRNTGIALPPDSRLLADLTAPKWKLEGTMIQVESREQIIERIGRSPDWASAIILALIDTPKRAVIDAAYGRTSRQQLNYDPLGMAGCHVASGTDYDPLGLI